MLDAVDAPTGRMPVVVGNGFGGVLLHEAVGHGLEADAIQKRASIYAGRLGDKLRRRRRHRLRRRPPRRTRGARDGIDDEGTPTQRTTIIEDGELTSYLYDLVRARKDGVASTGNGRRESFRHIPVPRMTNTFFAPGRRRAADELIAGVERGLYAVSFGGGQVEPATGDFVFGVSEGYLIEDGKVTAPVRGATLIGNGIEALAGDRRDRRRPGHRHGLLRQGRPARAPPASASRTCASARAHGRRARRRERPRRPRGRRAPRGRRRAGRRRGRRRGLGRALDRAPDPRLRRQRREPDRRHERRRRRPRVHRRPGRLRVRHRHERRRACASSAAAAHAAAAIADADEYAGLPDDVGRDRRSRASRSPELAGWSTEQKIELAIAIERAARAHEGISQVEDTVYSDGEGAVALANSRGFAGSYEATSAWAYCSAFAGEGADLMTGAGRRHRPRPRRAIDPRGGRRRGGRARARAASARASRRAAAARSCSTRSSPRRSSASSAGCCRPTPCSAAARCSPTGRATRSRPPLLRVADDGTDPGGLRERAVRRRGLAAPPDPADRGRPAGHVPLRRAHGAARRPRDDRQRRARLVPDAAGRRARRTWWSSPATRRSTSSSRAAGDGLYVTDVAGLHSGVNPVSGTFSVGATGRLIEGGELAAPVREITIASDLVTMLKGVQAVGSQPAGCRSEAASRRCRCCSSEMTVSGS